MLFEDFFNNKTIENNDRRGKFLSRLFGIFSEEIVNIWCENSQSPYENLGRPTLIASDGKYYVLDFTFVDKENNKFIVEMKSEIQYENYKYMVLDPNKDVNYLSHHLKKMAFKLFVNKDWAKVKIKGKEVVDKEEFGTILIWGSLKEKFSIVSCIPQKEEQVFLNTLNIQWKKKYGEKEFNDVDRILSVEQMINDLIDWKDKNYANFIQKYQDDSNELFNNLKGVESR